MWQPIESAPKNEPILIRYLKKGKSSRSQVWNEWIVTQAIGKKLFLHSYEINNDINQHTYNSYRDTDEPWSDEDAWTVTPTEYVEWVDGLDRLIVNTSSQKIVNQVTHWMPIPPLEEEK